VSISLLKHANQNEICWTPEIYHPQGSAAGCKLPTWVTHSEQHIFNSKNPKQTSANSCTYVPRQNHGDEIHFWR